jgi:hypothetical protein
MYKRHNKDPREKILEAVKHEGCLPDHYDRMSAGELASFERVCKKFENFLKNQEPSSPPKPACPDKRR